MNTNLTRRFALAAAALATFSTLGAFVPASAQTPGNSNSCDFGAPSIPDSVCVDSDDLHLAIGSAHTDNGVLSDDLDVDWYDEIGGNNRKVRVRGAVFIDAGAVGKATLRVRCVRIDGSIQKTDTTTLTSSNSFHAGLSKNVSVNCSSPGLARIDAKLTFEAFGGPSSANGGAPYKGA